MLRGGDFISSLPQGAQRVDVASIENSDDYLVNHTPLPSWVVKVLCVGKPASSLWIGAGATAEHVTKLAYYAALGRPHDDPWQAHMVILRGSRASNAKLAAADQFLSTMLTTNGPLWTHRR